MAILLSLCPLGQNASVAEKGGLGDTHRAERLCGQSASRLGALGYALATVPPRSARGPRRTATYQRAKFPRFRPDNARDGGFVPANLSRLILLPSGWLRHVDSKSDGLVARSERGLGVLFGRILSGSV
jgi:hypothetical protein